MSGMSLGGSDAKDRLEEPFQVAMSKSTTADEIDAVWILPSDLENGF